MWKEFREFAIRGNVVDMAVGLIIGAAFGAIVTSLVNDVIMPPIGLLLGGVDFANLFLVLKEGAKGPGPYATLADAKAASAVTLNIGVFINAIISFTIVAFAVFMVVKGVNAARREPAPAAAPPAPTPSEAVARRDPRSAQGALAPRSRNQRTCGPLRATTATGSGECGIGARLGNRRGLLRAEGDKPDLPRRWQSAASPSESRSGGGLGAPCTATTQSDESRQPGSPGNSEATWPSGPTPSSTRSSCGGVPATAHSAADANRAASSTLTSRRSHGMERPGERHRDGPASVSRTARAFESGCSCATKRSSARKTSTIDHGSSCRAMRGKTWRGDRSAWHRAAESSSGGVRTPSPRLANASATWPPRCRESRDRVYRVGVRPP